ncbi:MAG: hypothetical protein E6Q97_04255 [Desulfurellales bacterium]|nr:MAG: hypothetical protein E6Q97_04255 [Desulfurellales bacterium]
MERERCYACDLLLSAKRPLRLVNVAREDQNVEVGPECYRNVQAAGADGWQPSKGGPRLYPIEFDPRRKA